MKIKAVCELTGLSDRTIRYYIEQKLITPNYTENYLGRKTFDFSEKDIDELKSISTLRKFDFTIEEIREIIADSRSSTAVIAKVKERTRETVLEGKAKLVALDLLDEKCRYTVKELADKLTDFSGDTANLDELPKPSVKKTTVFLLKVLTVFILVWLPIVLSLYVFILLLREFRYPVFNIGAILLTLFFLGPSFGVMVISKTRSRENQALKVLFLVLCVLSIPFSMISTSFVVTTSETTDISNYRECTNSIDLFPDFAINDIGSDFYYHYTRGLDYTNDVYAQWILSENEFLAELERIDDLLEEYSESAAYGDEYTVMQQGDFTCMIFYNTYYKSLPFEKVTDNYYFYIFAYSETDYRVRYIYCNSLENGVDQPYYLELDWD